MKNIIKDDLNNFVETFRFVKKDFSSPYKITVIDRYQRISSLKDISFKLHVNSDYIEDLNIEKIYDLNQLMEHYDSEDVIEIRLSYEKTSDDELCIFDMNVFLLNNDLVNLNTFWHKIFTTYSKIRYFNDELIATSLKIKKLQTCSISSQSKFSQLDTTIEYFYQVSQNVNNLEFKNDLKVLASFNFLKSTSSAYDLEDNISFEYEGFRSLIIPSCTFSELLDVSNSLNSIHNWLKLDKHFSSKLGILRNILSLSKTTKLNQCFNQELINALESNFQIYLKENINQYFEIKNKVSEFIYDLSNKSFETLDQYTKNAQNLLLAVLSYFFTVVVFTTIDKNNSIENMFTYQLGTLSSIFIAAAIYLLYKSRADLEQKSTDILSKMIEIKGRYRLILSEAELDEMFTSPTLNDAVSRIKNSKVHKHHIIFLVIMLSILWLLIASK